jgi:hypothetical protein
MDFPLFPIYAPGPALTGPAVVSRATLAKSATKAADRQATFAAEGTALPIIYGQDVAPGAVAGVLSTGRYLWLVARWCAGECDSIVSVTMNGEPVPAGVSRYDRLGAPGQTVVTELQTACATKGIAYSDVLAGVCYSVFKVDANQVDTYPEFAAVIKGRKVATTSGGTPTWSDNPAYAIADFVESSVYGMGRTIDWASVATIAAKCDELVGGQKRRTINLSLINEQFVDAWLDTLRAYAGCLVSNEGGTVRLVPYMTGASVHAFDTSNIVAGSMRVQKSGAVDIPTVLRVSYTDTSTIPYRDGEAVAYAAGVLAGTTPWRETVQVPLPGINRYAQAMREAIERLNALTLSDLKATFGCFDIGLKLQLGDPITVTHPIGLTAKPMWLSSITDNGFGRYTLVAEEFDAAILSDAVVATPTTVDSGLVAAGTPPTVTGLAAAEEIYRTGDGLISSRLRVTWTDPEWPNTLNYLVSIADGTTLVHQGTAWDELYVSPALQEGKTYSITVVVVSRAGVAGAAASTATAMVGKVGVLPGNVPSFNATEAGGKVYAAWTAATDLDTLDYEIRYGTVGVAWDAATYVQRLAALAYTIDGLPPGTWDFLIKARDSYKQYSSAATVKGSVVVTLDSTAAQLGSKTFDAPTLVQMDAFTVAGVTSWATDNNENWDYGYTGANWNSDSRTNNVWNNPTSATGSSWTSNAWDLGSTVAATITATFAVTNIAGTAVIEIGASTNGSTYTWSSGAAAKVVARYVKIRATMASGGAMLVTGPVTATAAGYLRKESGQVTTSASAGALVQLAGLYAQARSIQLTANAAAAMQAVYDRVLVCPETGLQLETTLSSSGNTYQSISTTTRVIVTGDYLSFDCYPLAGNPDPSATLGVHLVFADASTLSCTGTTFAIGAWTAVSVSLAAAVGKTLNRVTMAIVSTVAGTHRLLVRNVRVTDSGLTLRQAYWTSGEPAVNSTYASAAATDIKCGPSNSFLAYCFDGANAQVAKPLSYIFEGA